MLHLRTATRLLLGSLALLAFSCSSTQTRSGPSVAAQVRFLDFKSGTEMRIVNDSWLIQQGAEGDTHDERRMDYYSRERAKAETTTKAADDKLFGGIMEFLESEGLDRHAVAGSASTSSARTKAIEVTLGKDTRTFYGLPGTPGQMNSAEVERAKDFQTSQMGLLDIFNQLPGFQSVKDHVMFEKPLVRPHSMNPAQEPVGSGIDTTAPLRALAILPARLNSTRLPHKVLLAESGLPLVVHSARNVAGCRNIQRVVVATDAEQVRAACAEHGIEATLTDPQHPSGSDRVHEAANRIEGTWDVIVNVQADEPELSPADLDSLVAAFRDPAVELATLAAQGLSPEEAQSPNVVSVVRDARGDAMYFSRAPIPDGRHARPQAQASQLALRHIGVYAFRPQALADFCALPVGRLEACESLEQLRWLEASRRMRVVEARHAPRGIDTRADYDEFLVRLTSLQPSSQQQR